VGKTRLAASFPNPIFIRAEDGLQSIPDANRPDSFPVVQKVDDLWQQFNGLATEKHDYRTLCLDSVTTLERIFTSHIVESDPSKPKSINQAMGGYGAGLAAVAAMHHRVRKACGYLNEKKGMNIVFIAHADTETIEPPDSEPFTRYSLRLGKKSMAPYVDESDIVGFLRLETFTRSSEGKHNKAFSTGQRELITMATAASVSKNRYGITEPLKVIEGQNPLKFLLGE
jgi:hypothetical protein